MKRFYFLILFFFCLLAEVFAQHPLTTIHLKNGDLPATNNLLNGKLSTEAFAKIHYSGKKYALLQFRSLPGPAEKAGLAAKGILLFCCLIIFPGMPSWRRSRIAPALRA
jgi:hypothetical protein